VIRVFIYKTCTTSTTKNPKNLTSNFFLDLPYSNKIGFLLRRGVCISMYNSEVLNSALHLQDWSQEHNRRVISATPRHYSQE